MNSNDAPSLRVLTEAAPDPYADWRSIRCPVDFHVVWLGLLDWRIIRSDIARRGGDWITRPIGHRFLTERAALRMRDCLRREVYGAWIGALTTAENELASESPARDGATQKETARTNTQGDGGRDE